jgi:hypothetical protein
MKMYNSTLNEDQLKRVIKIENELNEIESNVSDVELAINIIYEKCAEYKLQIQLHTEEFIARIKIENNLDINVDESELCQILQSQINHFKTKSESLIDNIEKHQKEYIASANQIQAKKFIQKNFQPLKHRIKELKEARYLCSNSSINYLEEILNKKEWKYFLFDNNLIELCRIYTAKSNEFPFFISFNQILSLGKSSHHTFNTNKVCIIYLSSIKCGGMKLKNIRKALSYCFSFIYFI